MRKDRVKIISRGLRDLLNSADEIKGNIHSVYRNACNIELNDSCFITLIDSTKSMVPMSISLSMGKEGFYEYRIFKGAEAVINKRELIIKNTSFKISIDVKEIWEEKPEFNFNKNDVNNLKTNLKVVEQGILLYGKLDAAGYMLSCVNEVVPDFNFSKYECSKTDKNFIFIKDNFIEFINAFIEKDNENISKIAEKTIGFGYGLTPSLDDFTAGLMISTIYMDSYFNKDINSTIEFNKNIIKTSLSKTTRISSEMLKHAVDGSGSQYVKQFIKTILSSKNQYEIIKDLNKLLSTGETSGTDIAAGLYTGIKLSIIKNLKGVNRWDLV